MAAALEAGVTRLFRIGGAHAIAALAYGTDDRSARGQDRRARQPLRRRGQGAASPRDCAIDFYAGPTEIVDRRRRAASRRGSPPTWSRRPSTIPTRAPIFITWSRRLRDARRARPSTGAAPAATIVRAVAAPRTARSIVARNADEAMALANRFAPEHLVVDREALIEAAARPPARCSSVRTPRRRPATTPPDRTTCCRPPAPRGSAAACQRRRLRPRDVGAAASRATGSPRLAPTIRAAGARRGARARTPNRSRSALSMSQVIPEAGRSCTTGCGCTRTRTPAAARRGCSRRWRACAPIRSASTRRTRRRRARARAISASRAERVTLVNGLDEGIMALAVALSAARRSADRGPKRSSRNRRSRSSAFDTAVVGGTARAGACRTPIHVSRSTTCSPRSPPNTRVVFLTNPNNPTGVGDAARRRSARSRARVPPGAIVFVDEAYAEFSGVSFIPELDAASRTSSSAGRSRRRSAWPACASAASSARRTTLEPIRLRGAGLQRQHRGGRGGRQAALADLDHLDGYLRAGRANRRRCSTRRATGSGCAYWTSASNFVLVRAGDRAGRAGQGRAARAASTCATARPSRAAPAACASPTGIVEHTRAVHRRDGGGAVRRAVIDRRTTETQIALTLGARRARAATRCGPASGFSITCWSCSRATARST